MLLAIYRKLTSSSLVNHQIITGKNTQLNHNNFYEGKHTLWEGAYNGINSRWAGRLPVESDNMSWIRKMKETGHETAL